MKHHLHRSAVMQIQRLLLVVLLIGIVPSLPVAASPHSSPQRTTNRYAQTTAGLVTARLNHTATLLQNGKVLITGGGSGESPSGPVQTILASAELFDPATGAATSVSPMHTARWYHTATLLPNGTVLVAGGNQNIDPQNSSGALSSAEIYNPTSNNWTVLTAPMPIPRAVHTATLLHNGKVLLVGGANVNGPLATADIYDPSTSTWGTLPTLMHDPRWFHTATLLPDGRVLVTGGKRENERFLDTAEIFNPIVNTWTPTANRLNSPRDRHTATGLPDGRVLIVGGYNGLNGTFLTNAELYDPQTNSWRLIANTMSVPRREHTATLLPDGHVLVAGGLGGFNIFGYPRAIEVYDAVTEQWSVIGSLAETGRDRLTATLLPSGQVLLVGGGNGAELNDTELITPAVGQWNTIGSITNARRKHTATLLPDGRVLLAGGYNDTNADSGGGFPSYATTHIYDPSSNTWSSDTQMTTARDNHTATLLTNGQVLVVGGRKNNISLATAELYDPAKHTWSSLPNMPEPRSMHTATLLHNGQVLITGGYNGTTALSTAVLYDPTKQSWIPTGSLQTARLRHTATLLPDGRVLVAGGTSKPLNTDAFNSAEVYDPTSSTWSPAASMGAFRNLHTATLLPNGQVLVVGGVSASSPLASAELYNPLTNSWTPTPTQPQLPRFWHMATLLADGRVLVAGGENGVYVAAAEIYNPGSGSWQTGNTLTTPRSDYTMTLLSTGRVLVTGGFNSSREQASAELFTPIVGLQETSRPVIMSVTSPAMAGSVFSIHGQGFQGSADGSSGSIQGSPTNYPLVQLRSLANEQITWLTPRSWSSTTITGTLPSDAPPGYALATVFASGIPSISHMIQIVRNTTWYIAPVGDDTKDCQTPASACRTISAAISKAADGDVINIGAGTYVENITLDRSLSLIGTDATTTIIDGGAAGRTIMINVGISVSISGVTIRNGKVGGSGGSFGGAGIYNSGTLKVVNSVVRDNTSGSFAGGIYNDHGRTMTLTNVQVLNNKVTPLDNVIGNRNGGGIVNSGSMTVTDSLIQGNSADLGTLVDSVTDSVGGGIFNDGNSQLTLVNTKVLNNTTTTTPGGRSAEGAGIQNYGKATIEGHSVIQGNIAKGKAAAGGGLYNVADSVVLNDSVISNNLAQSINGTGLSAHGGGIQNDATLILRQSVISGNNANGDNSLGTEVRGGGINNDASLTLMNSTISNNTAQDGAASVHGGGIASSTPNSTLLITESLISDNTTVGATDSLGGGIYSCATLKIDRSIINRNHTRGIGGGAGLYECGHSDIASSTFSENIADSGGGAIANAGFMTLTNSTISGNQVIGSSGNGTGGGIANASGDLAIRNTTITNNTAPFGGGIAHTNRSLTLVNTILAGNHAANGPDCVGSLGSQGYNLIGSLSGCAFSQISTDQISLTGVLDPRLGPLASNGGPTQTHALRPGSPAFDAGDDANCPAADQRGVARPQGAHCDIGAYEGGGVVAGLRFSAEPGRGQANQPLPIQPVVVAVDDQGNGVAFNGVVTLSLIGGASGAQLSGDTSLSAVNGRIAFANLQVNIPGTGYRLVATATGLAPATSGQFEILAPPPPPNTDPPSEVEPNDTLAQANKLFDTLPYTAGLTSDHDARMGLISATAGLTTDIDLYRFEVGPKSRVHIRLTGLNSGPNHLPANYDMLLLSGIGAASEEGTLELGKIADIARNFIARNFIARNFIARNFIARNFIGDTLGALSDNSGSQDEDINTFIQNGGTYYLIVYGADEQQNSATQRYRLDVERHIGELPLPPNTAHPISGLLSGGLPAQLDPQVRTIYLYNSDRIGTLYNQDPAELHARDDLNGILTSSNALMNADAAGGKGKGIAIDLSRALQPTDAYTMTQIYQQWDGKADEDLGIPARTNPLFANEVAREIRYVLDYALTRLYTGTTDIVLVGGDNVIPFYRAPDETTFANESDYSYQLQGTGLLTDTALIGGMSHSFIQTDNFYATRKPIFWRNRGLYVPDLGIGRLVERPSEIVHFLRSYLDSPSAEPFTIDARFATPPNAGAAFVTGYGFLSDQAQELATQINNYGLTNYTTTATLGTTYTLNLLNDGWDINRFSDTWLSGQLPQLTLTAPYTGTQTRYDLSALNGHFSHYGAEPAIGDTAIFSAEQLLDLTSELDKNAFFKKDGRPTLIYSIGCHSGLSATDQAFSTPFYRADFPQAVLKQGGNWIGSTGYAYGDSDLVAFSERLSVLFTSAIGRTIPETAQPGKDLGAPIGESLARAKWDYLPKGSGSFSVYDEKVVEEMTLYGLPFIRVKVPKPTPPPQSPDPQVWESIIGTTDILTRLITIDTTFTQPLTKSTGSIPQVQSSVQDSFLPNRATAINIEDRMANGQPVLPVLRYDTTLQPSKPGLVTPFLRSVRLIKATSNSLSNFNPYVARTITDTLATPSREPALTSRNTWLPELPFTFLQTVQHPGAIDAITTTNLLVLPAQFNARNSKTGTLRRFTHMEFELTYIVPGSIAASAQQSPLISVTQISVPNRQGTAHLRTTGFAGQDGASLQVSALYTTDGQNWRRITLPLVSRRSGRYEARIPAKRGSAIYAFFEARDRFGNNTIVSAQR